MSASRPLLTAALLAALVGTLPGSAVAEVTVVQSSQNILLDANAPLNDLPQVFTGLQGLANAGRPLYESLGFTASNEMEWTTRR